MRRLATCASLAGLLAGSSPAFALTQPGSAEPIPVLDESETSCTDVTEQGNVQLCLDEEEGDQTIDAQSDAAITPETFDPRCNMTFHVLARGADFNNVFGWYNVVRDADGNSIKPMDDELYVFILGNEDPPFTRALEVRDDPRYLGGEIGFFIATGSDPGPLSPDDVGEPPSNYDNLFYTELVHNPNQPGESEPSIHNIIWQSVSHPDSFYFGWEDVLDVDDNDNDFDDIFTRVSGIQCAGGGAACATDLEGICSDGTMQCQQGELTCVPNLQPGEETCNALDDDCDGETDEGDGLCEADHICDRGKCVPKCGTGEFRCGAGLVCGEAGACVDPRCEAVECPEGQVCEAGECIDGCAGVICPYGEVCRIGVCVDPCESIECDDGYACHLGVCVDCDCAGCEDGQTCSSDVCVENDCVDVNCEAGTHCQAGACVDDCEGVTCPGGAACVAGECGPPGSGSGGDGSGGADGSGGTIVIGSGGSAAAGPGTGASSGDPVGERDVGDDGGCGCRTAGSGASAVTAWLAALVAAGFIARRRRR